MDTFKQYYNLFNEGGAGGHMAHPFDLNGINTGKQLLALFNKVVKHIEKKSAAVKLDGINVSVKLVQVPNGGWEWAMDRGSSKDIDVEGITMDRLEERFPPSMEINPESGELEEKAHGMIKAGQIVIAILNEAMTDPEVFKAAKRLRLMSTKKPGEEYFLNAEFIEKAGTNVIKYGKNMIAFHGVNKFKWKKTGKSRKGHEVNYNTGAFTDFVTAVNRFSTRADEEGNKVYDFDTHGIIDVSFSNVPDFDSALDTPIEIILTSERSEKRSLRQWLFGARNPRDTKITNSEGRRVNAMLKQVYQYVIGSDNVSDGPLNEYIPDSKEAAIAIDAAIFWHATRLLGAELNKNLETFDNKNIPVGEGIVIRDLPAGKGTVHPPFKVTGEFIIGGLQSGF